MNLPILFKMEKKNHFHIVQVYTGNSPTQAKS